MIEISGFAVFIVQWKSKGSESGHRKYIGRKKNASRFGGGAMTHTHSIPPIRKRASDYDSFGTARKAY